MESEDHGMAAWGVVGCGLAGCLDVFLGAAPSLSMAVSAAGVDPTEKMHDIPLHDPDEEQGQVEGEGQVEAAASGGESTCVSVPVV